MFLSVGAPPDIEHSLVTNLRILQASDLARIRLQRAEAALKTNEKMMKCIGAVTDNMDVVLGIIGVVSEVSTCSFEVIIYVTSYHPIAARSIEGSRRSCSSSAEGLFC